MGGNSCQKPYDATGDKNYREREAKAKAQLDFAQADEPPPAPRFPVSPPGTSYDVRDGFPRCVVSRPCFAQTSYFPTGKIHKTTVLYTLVDGKVVYQSALRAWMPWPHYARSEMWQLNSTLPKYGAVAAVMR
jgi:hypothetical protein